MVLKKKIAATLIALSAASAIGLTASASTFRLTPHVGEPSVLTPLDIKRFQGDATVVVDEGIPSSDYVGFRVRNASEAFASEYVEAGFWDMWEGVCINIEYYTNEGTVGKYYHLASSYAAGQSTNYLTVKGNWDP